MSTEILREFDLGPKVWAEFGPENPRRPPTVASRDFNRPLSCIPEKLNFRFEGQIADNNYNFDEFYNDQKNIFEDSFN